MTISRPYHHYRARASQRLLQTVHPHDNTLAHCVLQTVTWLRSINASCALWVSLHHIYLLGRCGSLIVHALSNIHGLYGCSCNESLVHPYRKKSSYATDYKIASTNLAQHHHSRALQLCKIYCRSSHCAYSSADVTHCHSNESL